MNKEEIFVAHMDTSIMYVGTKEECEAYRNAQPYRTDCWAINE